MTAGLVDSHCHLAHVEGGPEAVIAEAGEAGVDVVIDIGMGTEESAAAVRRASDFAPHVYASVGIHPNDLEEFESAPDAAMATLRDLAAAARVVGVGETGLDHYRDRSPADLQERAFRAHIILARELELALVVHCRDAHGRLLEILEEEAPPSRVVMHCFSGDVAFAQHCSEHGYYCSFAGNLTYKKSDELREAAKAVAPELLLAETDAPYLAPDPHRGKPNSPALLPHTVDALAKVRSVPVGHLTDLLRVNTFSAFGIR